MGINAIDWTKRITVEDKQRQWRERAYLEWKANRQAAVDAITVTVGGMVFDGDEESQNRMARAVAVADTPEQTTEWTLHNNTVAVVTAAQLKQALLLAGDVQTALWNDGRPVL